MTPDDLEIIDILRRAANDTWGLALSEFQLEQCARYAALLVEWNATRMNLTRLTTPRDIAVKHFLDAFSVPRAIAIPPSARLIDIGTGAGFPGLALKIVRPDLRVTLLDSTAKKLTFCRAVADDLQLTDVVTLHARAEDAGRLPAHARGYDIVVARALAPFDRLLPWCAPFLSRTGQLVVMKGPQADEELDAARPIARKLGITLAEPIAVELPDAEERIERRIIVGRRT